MRLRSFSFLALALALALAGAAQAAEPPRLPPMPSPPYLPANESLKLFELPPGYHLELVLSEPLIAEPVVTAFDGNGRMFVAEMRSYMKDIDATDEKAPVSRVSMHWSSQGNGVFDRHSVFIDRLMLPRILLPLRDSLLVQETDTNDIYEYRDTDGDGIADDKKLFYAGGPRQGNLEHQPSGLIWSTDNWLYTTYNAYRIRWTPTGIIKEPTAPNGGQWGLTQDDYGKPWIVNAGGELGPINFQQPIVYGAFKFRDEVARDYKEVWPLVPIPDVQGGTNRFRPVEKTLNHITAACGADVYRGDRLPADLAGDLLYCEPVGRLIRRTKIDVKDGLTTLRNAYEKSEFIRSSDPYFRPVNLVTGPDGTLYITDMYRGIIQEGNWTKAGSYLRTVIQQYSLDKNVGGGRIWRLVHDSAKPGPAPRLLDEIPAQLVTHLAHPNGWWRDTAQKLLVLAQDKSVAPALKAMARTHPNPLARLHALWTLEGLGALDADLVREKFKDASTPVRVAALRTTESLVKQGDRELPADVLALVKDADPAVAIQAMMTADLLKLPGAKALIQKTAVTGASIAIKEIGTQLLNPLASQIANGYSGAQKTRLERGKQIYMELCFACHGVDGKGTPTEIKDVTLAPPLAGSATAQGHRDLTVSAVLFGVAGPIDGRNYEAAMIPMGANDDEWIAAVVSYIRTAFGNGASTVDPKDVARVRAANPRRTDPWTLDTLRPLHAQPLSNRAEWKFTSNRARKTEPVTASPAKAIATTTATTASTMTPTPAPIIYATGSTKLPLTVEKGQTASAWVQIELPELATLSEVRLGSSKSPNNYIRACDIEVSEDGTHWGSPVVSGKSAAPILELSFSPTRAKFVRITSSDPSKNWSWALDNVVLFTPAISPGHSRTNR